MGYFPAPPPPPGDPGEPAKSGLRNLIKAAGLLCGIVSSLLYATIPAMPNLASFCGMVSILLPSILNVYGAS